MTITLELGADVENGLAQSARREGKTPEQLASETLRANFAPQSIDYPTATQLLRMPKADRDRYLEEAAVHAAPLYEADLALPPEQRELTAPSAIEDDMYTRYDTQFATG